MIIFVFISIAYLILMISLIYGWQQIPEFSSNFSTAETGFSIIIPFRNEGENLPVLLKSLAELQYPADKFEISLINDASEDDSVEICKNFQQNYPEFSIKILENNRQSNSPKKDAITTAIEKAEFKYILTTDADCRVPKLWLQTYNDFIKNTQAALVAGPVSLTPPSPPLTPPEGGRNVKPFRVFEELDVLSLQAAGAGAFGIEQAFMCNGANLCYRKEAFLEVDGFSGNDKIASGDDVFLLQKFQQKKYKVNFLKSQEAIVQTQSQKSFRALISQRIRWAAKAPAYKSLFSKFAGAIVLLMNAGLLVGAVLALMEIWPYYPVLIIFLLKFNVDFALLYLSAKFFKREEVLRSFFWSSLAYPFFSTYVALKSLVSGYEWKGRKFRS
ncbi:MAG: glycosyltransferase [Salegentibacter sp.]|uniref:glycosyltransferase family 2 protein n=1 Tax=Salegentibacter sp. TaxID=1903072 RepID=UPI002870980E|nr:glycosyltransferase [Salegentibacter sp.]MDR9456568.1 glycosyltransferase [Salegentibacter sp.]